MVFKFRHILIEESLPVIFRHKITEGSADYFFKRISQALSCNRVKVNKATIEIMDIGSLNARVRQENENTEGTTGSMDMMTVTAEYFKGLEGQGL